MKSMTILATLCLMLCVSVARADDLADQVKANPNDAEILNKFFGERFGAIGGMTQSDPDAAEQALEELAKFVGELEITDEKAKQLLGRAEAAIGAYKGQIELARITLEEIVAKLKEDPNDVKIWSQFQSKVGSNVSANARTNPDEAEATLSEARELIASLMESADDDKVKALVERMEQGFERYDSTIAAGRKLLALVGKDAASLDDISSFVNGPALIDGDLKGKVVFLDFWAVWCGPCIATFPHLREWNEQYADKGLVMVGITSYYNYEWNSEAGRATRSQGKVTPEQENEMLAQFAEEHDLHHVFAVQSEDSTLSEYYGVTGIPHAVLIDREGKIRMIRVGSGPQNAKDLEAMIEELINE